MIEPLRIVALLLLLIMLGLLVMVVRWRLAPPGPRTQPYAPGEIKFPLRQVTRCWEPAAFHVLLFLSILPIWMAAYFPSQDGPEHLHNAFVLLHLNTPG